MNLNIKKAIPLLQIFINMIRLKNLLLETSNINKIEEIGPQNFIELYLDWLEELLNDLEDSNDIENITRYDTVLNARFALEDADSTEIIQYLQRKYGNDVDQIILKIIGDTPKYDASGIDTPGDPNM